MELPEDKPEDIERVLSYLYTGSYEPDELRGGELACEFQDIEVHFAVYVAAGHMLLLGLRDIAFRRIDKTCPVNSYWPNNLVPFVGKVFECTTTAPTDIQALCASLGTRDS